MADECISFLKKNKEKPFFLTFWNYSVHYPIEAPEDLIEKYKKRGVENPAYAAMIEGMDISIGRVLKSLEDLGVADNTLVIFTSDNGSLFTNGPLRQQRPHLRRRDSRALGDPLARQGEGRKQKRSSHRQHGCLPDAS